MAVKGTVNLGDEVKDDITGLMGVVIAITNWLNGCQRVAIQPREVKDNKPADPYTMDVEQAIVMKSSVLGTQPATGGARDNAVYYSEAKR